MHCKRTLKTPATDSRAELQPEIENKNNSFSGFAGELSVIKEADDVMTTIENGEGSMHFIGQRTAIP